MDRNQIRNSDKDDRERTRAKATIQAADGVNITGEARFTEENDGVKIVVEVIGAPAGQKGIHIHEKGDCSDIRGESMGSHFAPGHKEHGLPSPLKAELHLGDLGNIEIKDDGTGKKEITVNKANLRDGDPMSFLGKSLVIHQDEDKGASHQPSGGSGAPIACAVIEKDTSAAAPEPGVPSSAPSAPSAPATTSSAPATTSSAPATTSSAPAPSVPPAPTTPAAPAVP